MVPQSELRASNRCAEGARSQVPRRATARDVRRAASAIDCESTLAALFRLEEWRPMPFTFKLSKRLALSKTAVALPAALLAACEKPLRLTSPTPPGPVVQVVTSPDSVTLDPYQAQQFVAYGRTQAGESVALAVGWGTSGGTITRHRF